MKKNFKYDVFISYKRKGGTPWAELLFLALDKIAGKRVFIDRHGLKGGFDKKWETLINEAIESSVNVVVVIFPGIQDVIIGDNDYFIKEIVKALEEKKERRLNIIPFYVEGLSSEIIHSSNQYKDLQDKLLTITSTDYEDVNFDYKHPYTWIDDLVKALNSEEEILEEYCYRIQVNALSKMTVHDGSHIKEMNKYASEVFWLEKANAYLVLRFEASDGYKYTVEIDTTNQNESKTPREYSAYYNLKEGVIHPDGLIRMDGDTIILTVDWDMIKILRSEKVALRTIERIMPSHKGNELPLIEGVFNNLNIR